MTSVKIKSSWLTIVSRGVLFSLIWWVLTDGTTPSWWIGVPAVLLATTASVALLPPTGLVWYEFLRFMPFFLIRSLIGGIDVAWRAFHPDMPIAPDIIEYPMRLPPGLSQVLMVMIVNLLPGTLSAELGEHCIKVHVLNGRKDFLSELEAVEQNIARVFGTSLKVSGGSK